MAKRTRSAALLPPVRRNDRPLFFVVAIIVALACMSGVAARAAWSASSAWTSDLSGAMTVEVRPRAGDDPSELARRAAEAVARTPGVAAATAMTRAEQEDLLAPWFGAEGLPADVPLPGVVDVRLERLAPATADEIAAALAAAGLDARVDDHGRWTRDLKRAAVAVRALAFGALLMLAGAAVAVTGFATRASLAARADVVEVLHLVGARDEFIAKAFTGRFIGLGVRAGILGAFLAALAAAGFWAVSGGLAPVEDNFLPRFSFAPADVIILASAPLVSAFVAAMTARETVLKELRRTY